LRNSEARRISPSASTESRYNRRDVSPQARKAVAVVCIALVLVAGILPAVSAAFNAVILVALWLVTPAVVVTVVRRIASDSEEQPVSLLSLFDSRGPPHLLALA
jgi:hypothetical protein